MSTFIETPSDHHTIHGMVFQNIISRYHLEICLIFFNPNKMLANAIAGLNRRLTTQLSHRFFTTVPIFQVDSFSNQPFQGNPAAVCLLPASAAGEWPLDNDILLAIAAENNLSETAFLIPQHTTSHHTSDAFTQESHFHLRWFTPTTEVDLCGHATLATAAVLLQKCNNTNATLHFETKSGELICSSNKSSSSNSSNETAIEMELPLNPPVVVESPASSHLELVNVVLGNNEDSDNNNNNVDMNIVDNISYSSTTKKFVVTLDADKVDRSYLESLNPSATNLLSVNQDELGSENVKGVIVTLQDSDPHSDFDFISRYFAPWVGIEEDPVTGSAHTVIAPMWSQRFNNQIEMKSRQCSPRGGNCLLRMGASSLFISGEACVVLDGMLRID